MELRKKFEEHHHVTSDTEIHRLLGEDSEASDFISTTIDEAKSKGGVLVHCVVGKSRSVTIVVAYLMKKHGMSLSDAMEFVKNKRPIAGSNSGFITQLQNFEQSIRVANLRKEQDS